ncbi:hypothetical protein [Pelagicoccus sp. SDUM812002]|uniref:hypothetical protein n=1 Tax=Pelagicoccus sp. SDUM812002 TaxID=3041266 RepID=UPI00280EFB1D|nr:hypothetical protein [Pelagicoccus sp. SDUM812002]MDQ8185907.1 hypothetical protein [Pelagicoccus sp. SDUM812002]
MKHGTHKNFSKLQIICALFADDIGDDLYFARQIKESIEATLPEEKRDHPESFLAAAQTLLDQTARDPDRAIIDLISVPEAQGFSELALRARLLEGIKRTCRFEKPLLVLTGLKEAICPTGKRWTARRAAAYQEAIAYARDFCQSRTRPSSHLNLIIY